MRRSTPLKRTGRIRPRSPRAQAVAAERRDLRLVLLAERGPSCQACHLTPVGANPPRPWVDMDEVKRRSQGGDPTNPDEILCLCRPCHDWKTTHPAEAHALGLHRWSWESVPRRTNSAEVLDS